MSEHATINAVPRTQQDEDNALLVRALVCDKTRCGAKIDWIEVDGIGLSVERWQRCRPDFFSIPVRGGLPILDDDLRAALRRALGES